MGMGQYHKWKDQQNIIYSIIHEMRLKKQEMRLKELQN